MDGLQPLLVQEPSSEQCATDKSLRSASVDSATSTSTTLSEYDESDESDQPRISELKTTHDFSTFTKDQENAAAEQEANYIEHNARWYRQTIRDCLGPYEWLLAAELDRVSPATRIALMRNMQDYPLSQIESEGYKCPRGHSNDLYTAVALQKDRRACYYVDFPEKLPDRKTAAQIWCENAPPLLSLPPEHNMPFDEAIFNRPKARKPVPPELLYEDNPDPLATIPRR